MGFIDKNLLPEEQIFYRTRLHWVIYLRPFLILALALGILVYGLADRDQPALIMLVALIVGLAGLLSLLSRWILSRTSEFAVTNRRVLIKVGFIRRHSLEILLRQVEGIGVDQGLIGRLMNYGAITVSGTGGTKEPFRRIRDPLEFRRQVQSRTV